jgi:hypothetical protein
MQKESCHHFGQLSTYLESADTDGREPAAIMLKHL